MYELLCHFVIIVVVLMILRDIYFIMLSYDRFSFLIMQLSLTLSLAGNQGGACHSMLSLDTC